VGGGANFLRDCTLPQKRGPKTGGKLGSVKTWRQDSGIDGGEIFRKTNSKTDSRIKGGGESCAFRERNTALPTGELGANGPNPHLRKEHCRTQGGKINCEPGGEFHDTRDSG